MNRSHTKAKKKHLLWTKWTVLISKQKKEQKKTNKKLNFLCTKWTVLIKAKKIKIYTKWTVLISKQKTNKKTFLVHKMNCSHIRKKKKKPFLCTKWTVLISEKKKKNISCAQNELFSYQKKKKPFLCTKQNQGKTIKHTHTKKNIYIYIYIHIYINKLKTIIKIKFNRKELFHLKILFVNICGCMFTLGVVVKQSHLSLTWWNHSAFFGIAISPKSISFYKCKEVEKHITVIPSLSLECRMLRLKMNLQS